MQSHLILVEGIPGSGKSTTAAMIAAELRKNGKHVICVDEGAEDHPADYRHYDFPDFETERNAILAKWRSFVGNAAPDTLYVFNCIYLQNPMCETMMRFGMEEDASQKYIQEITEIIRPLHPIVLYIDEPDVQSVIDSVRDERGPDWLNAVIDYHVLQGYGKRHNLSGYAGYIRCLEERRARELRILQELNVEYYTICKRPQVKDLAKILSFKEFSPVL